MRVLRRVLPAAVIMSVLVVAAGTVVVSAGDAEAAGPTTTFTTPGESVYTVPDGVTRVDVVAVGGTGGDSSKGQSVTAVGGRGAQITATLDVTPGQKLYAVVGTNASGATPGANGGGAPGTGSGVCSGTAGGGGGATDVRTVPTGTPGSDASRIVVASGGGGAGALHTLDSGQQFPVYGGHRGLGGGMADRGGTGGAQGVGGAAFPGATAGTATAGGQGGVGAAGAGSGCGGGGGGGFGGGGGGIAVPSGARGGGGGGGGGGFLVPAGGAPAGMAARGDAPSVTFTAPGRPAPAGPLRVTNTTSLRYTDQGRGGITFVNCPTSCTWADGDATSTAPGAPRRDVGYQITQYWASAAATPSTLDFDQAGYALKPGPDASPAELGQPVLLAHFAAYNEEVRGESPTRLVIQMRLTVQPPAGPPAVFRMQGSALDGAFRVTFLETDNTPPCNPDIQRSTTPCDDRYSLDQRDLTPGSQFDRPQTRTITSGGLTWHVELLGFRTPSGEFDLRFRPEEKHVDQAEVYGRVTVDTVATASTLTVDDTTPASPVLTLTTTPAPQTGGTVTFTDTLAPIPGCTDVPVGPNGVTTCTPSGLTAGPHTFGGRFGGGVGYTASDALPVVYTVPGPAAAATTTTLTGPATGTAGASATFTATVSPNPGGGTVAFTDGTAVVPGCAAVPVMSGSAACTTSTLGVGPHVLTAAYGGTTGFAPSTSAPFAHLVGAPPPPDVCTPGAPAPAGYTVVRGTDRNDRLVGTGGNDIVYAGAGDDAVVTLGGDDIVCAGDGKDSVVTGAGNDEVFGGLGDDSLVGEDGDDTLRGGAGRDRLVGGNGVDRGIDADPDTQRVGIERTT